MPKRKPAQLELFAAAGEIHQLGLLGWEDALWTKLIAIPLLGGQTLQLNLVTIRRLRQVENFKALALNAASSPPASSLLPES